MNANMENSVWNHKQKSEVKKYETQITKKFPW